MVFGSSSFLCVNCSFFGLFFVSQGSYAYTIGKKMGSFGTIKSEASQTTGKNPSGCFMESDLIPNTVLLCL